MNAADEIVEVDARLAALGRIADTLAASQHQQQQQQQNNRYGLNRDEKDVARSCGLSEQQYWENKSKLRSMRQSGQYRDDQGTVRR